MKYIWSTVSTSTSLYTFVCSVICVLYWSTPHRYLLTTCRMICHLSCRYCYHLHFRFYVQPLSTHQTSYFCILLHLSCGIPIYIPASIVTHFCFEVGEVMIVVVMVIVIFFVFLRWRLPQIGNPFLICYQLPVAPTRFERRRRDITKPVYVESRFWSTLPSLSTLLASAAPRGSALCQYSK